MSPRVAEQRARIWEVLRGFILTLRLGDIAGFSSSHNRSPALLDIHSEIQQCWKRKAETKTVLCASIERKVWVPGYISDTVVLNLKYMCTTFVGLFVNSWKYKMKRTKKSANALYWVIICVCLTPPFIVVLGGCWSALLSAICPHLLVTVPCSSAPWEIAVDKLFN